jgi:uncharacterized membrane protein
MPTSTLEVFVAAFGSEDEANTALKDFQAMDREGSIELVDAAVIVHAADGKVHFRETADPRGKTWAKRGAIAGGLVGLRHALNADASAELIAAVESDPGATQDSQ